MFLSGTIVPIESTPLATRELSYLSPARYSMEIAPAPYGAGRRP